MSGFELAGIVLGAFPIAISAIDDYRRMARKVEALKDIRVTYLRCSEDLKNEALAFKRHLRMLVLPLVVDSDSANALLANPSGERWKDADIADLLETKLGESHELYLSYVDRMVETLAKISEEMAIDSDLVQDRMELPRSAAPGISRLRGALSKDSNKFLIFKMKFVQAEGTRRRLFMDLRDCNDKLSRLLDSSEKDAQLTKTLEAAQVTSGINKSMCTFWKTATAFFRALAAACRCQCCDDHTARLLLQHRASCKEKARFDVIFTMQSAQASTRQAVGWEACRTRIEEDDHGGFVKESVVLAEKRTTVCQPDYSRPTLATNTKVATRSKTATPVPSPARVQFLQSTPTILLEAPTEDPSVAHIRPIGSICESLCGSDFDCRGYLDLPSEDRRYYVYAVAQHDRIPPSVTLEQILNGDVKPSPSRRESYAIALIVASSFLQLLESPWLPNDTRFGKFDKTSIVFFADAFDPNVFMLHEPHIRRDFKAFAAGNGNGNGNSTSLLPDSTIQQQRGTGRVCDPLARLGIMLLELCFRAPLERQYWRTTWPSGSTDREKEGFDFLAARDWLSEVADEAGPDYAAAVSWCLVGNRSVPADKWRSEMLREVVKPLQRCLDCFKLAGSGST